jgi:WD40 repeat protein
MWFVDINSKHEAEVMPLAVRRLPSTPEIRAVGVSFDKTLAAVAQKSGRIILVCVPSLVELWQYTTEYRSISCCTFAPDDSFVLFGKLETVLNIAERKEVPFFYGNKGTFVSCAFSPNGKRLVTSNGSRTVKLWDVAKQCLLSLLCAESRVNWCSFSRAGLFIIGDSISDVEDLESDDEFERFFTEDWESHQDGCLFENSESDSDNSPAKYLLYAKYLVPGYSFCVWNTITLQRSDERIFAEPREGNTLQSKLCKCCFPSAFEILPPIARYKSSDLELLCQSCPTLCSGMYSGTMCTFALDEKSFVVIENAHFTVLAAWNFFGDDCCDSESWDDEFERSGFKRSGFKGSRQITAIENNYWLYADVRNLFVFRTAVTTCPTRVLWSSFSPDGSQLATCTSNGYINIWNVNTGQTEQRFKTNLGKSLFACWWSEKFLFVFNFWDRIASLWKYPVDDVDLKILFYQGQQVSLRHLGDEFVSLSVVADFSEGYLCYQ